MLTGRFGQIMETVSIGLILLGIFALCQNLSFGLFQNGFKILIAGWVGLTLWSHRRPVGAQIEDGNPQITVNGHAPLDVTITQSKG